MFFREKKKKKKKYNIEIAIDEECFMSALKIQLNILYYTRSKLAI